MRFLTRELDDPDDEPCGRCAVCAGDFAGSAPDPALVREAQRFLRRSYRPILPRRQWPAGLDTRSGRIPFEHQLREGRALAIYGDAGWGQAVKAGKYGEEGFADELADATVEMIMNDLQPDPFPTWVTAVPSLRHPELVPSFARRLADRLGLPYRSALVKVTETPQQKSMENSVQQARNAIDAFAAVPAEIPPEPVFLVDDMVDSGWSLTVCGVALAEAGSGPVFPVVLGQTSTGAAA
jgi:ATP-dependent DNA helicase RecQ